jgi:hypothetical protein
MTYAVDSWLKTPSVLIAEREDRPSVSVPAARSSRAVLLAMTN